MHELTVAAGIIEIAEATLQQNGLSKIHAINIIIGELTCVDEAALRFALEPGINANILNGAQVNILHLNALARCEQCNLEFEPHAFITQCPHCNSIETKVIQGRELYIKSIEAE